MTFGHSTSNVGPAELGKFEDLPKIALFFIFVFSRFRYVPAQPMFLSSI